MTLMSLDTSRLPVFLHDGFYKQVSSEFIAYHFDDKSNDLDAHCYGDSQTSMALNEMDAFVSP